jgi:hypothetical protein
MNLEHHMEFIAGSLEPAGGDDGRAAHGEARQANPARCGG